MSETIERIGASDIRRTGWTTVARRCPTHGDELELCFDETEATPQTEHWNHDDNRIRWRCSRCVGSWVENYFLYEEHGRTPQLALTCPACGSPRVDHQCDPGCCEEHACLDCGRTFEARGTLLRPGQVPLDAPLTFRRDVCQSQPGTPLIRSGITRSFRACDQHGPCELGFINIWAGQPPTVLAWYCAGCERTTTEGCFRVVRRAFIPDVRAGLACMTLNCGGAVVTIEGEHRCSNCGAVWAIELR